METQKNNGMCRCCASEGTFKDVKSSYQWMGEEEIYADMLRECLDIALCADVTGEVEGGICEVCITQLRNASNFKKQVLHTEEQFKQRIQDKLFKNEIVKVELSPQHEEDSDNDNVLDNTLDDDYSGTEYEVPVKTEVDESKPKKRGKTVKASTSRAKKLKKEDGESSKRASREQTASKQRAAEIANIKIESVMSLNEDLNIATQKLNKLKNLSVVKTSNIKKDVILESTVQDSNEKQKDEVISTEEFSIRQYRLAVKVILANSNATAISHHNGKGYKCCFCANQYADPAELKQHNLDVHIKDINRIGNKVDSKAKLMVKLDITKLTCNICQQEIATIDQLIQHLNDKHKKKVLVDIKKFILPFKFINDELRCIFCTKIFHTFKMLQTHMNSHYSNYTCELCSKGFVTRTSLMKHKFSHSPTETVTHEKVDTVKPEDGKNRKSENILACHCPLGKRDIQTNSNASVINKKVDTIKLRDNKNRKNEHILVYHWQSGIRDILSNSNATVIGGHQGTSFKCDFCTENFFLPSDLKQHNIQMHAKDICHFRKYQIKSKIFAKLDISDLRCNLCEQETSTIAELVEHLNSDHYKDIKPEIVKYILPFKFNGDELRCCVCSQIFHTFKSLQYHMHSHFSNFICKVCSAGFVARNALALHTKTHEIGSVKCSYCSKTFNHLRAKKYHEEYVHTTGIRKSVCRICNARFRDYRQKKIHLVRVHGVGSLEFKCQSCDKVFATSYGLLHHTNNFHLMMRPHQCPVCSKSFYSQPLLKNHLLIHTGEKEFQCDVCSKRFVRKTTLVEHMKIHMNDRRHKCELCGQAFVQKCSLKGHMRSRHGTLDK